MGSVQNFSIGLALALAALVVLCSSQQQFNNQNQRPQQFQQFNNNQRPQQQQFQGTPPQFQQQQQQFQQPQQQQFQQDFQAQAQPQQPQQQQQPQQFVNNNQLSQGQNSNSDSGRRYPEWLDTSDGKYAPFNGPVKGIPRDHGGGKYGAADCLLC